MFDLIDVPGELALASVKSLVDRDNTGAASQKQLITTNASFISPVIDFQTPAGKSQKTPHKVINLNTMVGSGLTEQT